MSAITSIRRKVENKPIATVGYCTKCKKLFFLEWQYPEWTKCPCRYSAISKDRDGIVYAGGKCIPMLFSRDDLKKLKDYETHGVRMKIIAPSKSYRIECVNHMYVTDRCDCG